MYSVNKVFNGTPGMPCSAQAPNSVCVIFVPAPQTSPGDLVEAVTAVDPPTVVKKNLF